MKIREVVIRVLRRLKLHKAFNFTIRIHLGSKFFSIPIINGIGLNFQSVGLDWMSDIIGELHKLKNGAILDIGANIGQTLLKIKSIFPDVSYYGFEPSPECNYYLHQLIHKNALTDCTIFPIGLSNKNNLELFVTAGLTDEGASIIPEIRPHRKAFRKQFVPVFTFDQISKNIDCEKISIVKIDVEGAEHLVLEGMKEAFSKYKFPFVICEILHAHSDKELPVSLKKNTQLSGLMKSLGYEIFRIIKNSEQGLLEGLEPVDNIDNLVWNDKYNSRLMCDYLFVEKEYVALVTRQIKLTQYSEAAVLLYKPD